MAVVAFIFLQPLVAIFTKVSVPFRRKPRVCAAFTFDRLYIIPDF
jgi:hypothetical protein